MHNEGMNYQKFLADNRRRAVEIVQMRKRKQTFAAIGKHFGITAQRAQQIYSASEALTK